MPETALPPLTTREIADRFRRDVNTVNGWINDGINTPAGERVHLRATKVGGCWNVEPADLVEFLRALNPETELAEAAREQRGRGKERAAAAARVRKKLGMG